MSNIKLLALDLDGTLLNRDSELPEENRLAVNLARAAGIETVIVTGRSWRSTEKFYREMEMTGPAICYLGALVLADGTGRIHRYRSLVPEAWTALREYAVAEGLAVTACMGTDQAVADGDLPARNLVAADTAFATCQADDFTNWAEWNPYTEIVPDLAPCAVPPIMAAVYGDKAVRQVMQRFPGGLPGSQFDLTDRIAGETVLHVWHAEVDKGLVLAEYCRARGIKPEEVAAFGDAPMDLGMIKYAGLGVAMPTGHPALQKAADLVATPAEAIAKILKG